MHALHMQLLRINKEKEGESFCVKTKNSVKSGLSEKCIAGSFREC